MINETVFVKVRRRGQCLKLGNTDLGKLCQMKHLAKTFVWCTDVSTKSKLVKCVYND